MVFYEDKEELDEAIRNNTKLRFLQEEARGKRGRDAYYMIRSRGMEERKYMGVLETKSVQKLGIAYNDPYNVRSVVNDQISYPTRMSADQYRQVSKHFDPFGSRLSSHHSSQAVSVSVPQSINRSKSTYSM
jgi:hypothetical protein